MIGDIVDKANLKEFIAIILGNVSGSAADSLLAGKLDSNQLLLAKTLGGLAATYGLNSYAETSGYPELLNLAGLATTAFAAHEPSKRVSIQVSKSLGKPVVVGSKTVRPVRVSRGIDVSPGTEAKRKIVEGVSIGR